MSFALRDVTDKTIAATMCGLDEPGNLGIIVKSLSQLTNGDFEDGLPDKGFRPNVVEKFVFRNELAWPPDELVKHSESFGPEFN
jgi:hypothetical protein